MTTPANNHNKPSPSDSPTNAPVDYGNKALVKPEDKVYTGKQVTQQNAAKKHEKEEQPVNPVKKAPKKQQPDASDDDARRLESK